MWSWIIKAVCSVVTWLFSERRAKAKEKAEREKVADEVARGDEDKVNARISKVGLVIIVSFFFLLGCFSARTVYVREGDKAIALQSGGVHTNTSETVEWILPRSVMTRLLNAAEAK